MKFINLPRKLNLEFYQNCQEQFVGLCRKNQDILAVYTAGSVSAPGISDLDFIICLKDKLTKPVIIEQELDKDLDFVIGGGSILKVNKKNFKQIKIIDDFRMARLRGKKFEFQEFGGAEFEICRVMDWLPERLFTLLKLKNSQEIDVVRGLQIIKSAAFSLEKLAALTSDDSYNTLIRQSKELRDNWFRNENRLKDFENLLRQAILEVEKGIKGIDIYVKSYISAPVIKNKIISFAIKNGPRFLFGKKTEIKNREVILLYSFYYFLAAQALLGKGFISECLVNCFNKNLTNLIISDYMDGRLIKVIKKRVNYCNQLAGFFRNNNLKSGLLKYGWFLK